MYWVGANPLKGLGIFFLGGGIFMAHFKLYGISGAS